MLSSNEKRLGSLAVANTLDNKSGASSSVVKEDPTTEPDVQDTSLNAEAVKAGAIGSGFAYRGIVSRGDGIVWACPHTHFTDHSAKACAAGHLQRSEPDAPSNVSAS